jgi:osmoprotectant transport system permease protein
MRVLLVIAALLIVVALWPQSAAPPAVRIGSKVFTESVILGDALTQLVEASGDPAVHRAKLGGSQIVYDALRRGEIDAYPEYTGTIRQDIFAGRSIDDDAQLRSELLDQGIAMSKSLGFSNNYALAVRRETAEQYQIEKISDLVRQPDLRFGFSSEFMQRSDGWPNLRTVYSLPQQPVGMDHDLSFRHLEEGELDVIDVYTTEARLQELDLVVLEDDRDYFPVYDAVILSRIDLADRYPGAVQQIARLEGAISEPEMIALNAEVQANSSTEAQVAAKFLRSNLGVEVTVADDSVRSRILHRTIEHLDLVRRSLIPAVLVAIPLGVFAAKRPVAGRLILGAVGVVQTIPALALLVLLIPVAAKLHLQTLGAGSATAVLALFLYSLLPIVQNTAAGLSSVAPEYRESAAALGLPSRIQLLRVELPLASPAILAGIKTATVLNVGFATLGALVGAGGYGQPILDGIRVNSTALILEGAVPAACLAVLLQLLFELAERWLVPAGLRLKTNHDA